MQQKCMFLSASYILQKTAITAQITDKLLSINGKVRL